jgi:hypothetical protein
MDYEALCTQRKHIVCKHCPRHRYDEGVMMMHLVCHHTEQLVYIEAGKTSFRIDDRSA